MRPPPVIVPPPPQQQQQPQQLTVPSLQHRAGAAAAATVGGRVAVAYTGPVHRAGDRLIVTVGELSKALLRECVHLTFQAAMGVVAGALDVTLQVRAWRYSFAYAVDMHIRMRARAAGACE